MLTTTKNWGVVTYTNSTWTNIVAEPSVIATVVISNTSSTLSITVGLQLTNAAGAGSVQILKDIIIEPNSTYTLDVRSLCVTNNGTQQVLQVMASAAGINFLVSGAV